jgi:hypothetical protein
MRGPVAATCHYLIQALALNPNKTVLSVKEIEARPLEILELPLGMHLSPHLYY